MLRCMAAIKSIQKLGLSPSLGAFLRPIAFRIERVDRPSYFKKSNDTLHFICILLSFYVSKNN